MTACTHSSRIIFSPTDSLSKFIFVVVYQAQHVKLAGRGASPMSTKLIRIWKTGIWKTCRRTVVFSVKSGLYLSVWSDGGRLLWSTSAGTNPMFRWRDQRPSMQIETRTEPPSSLSASLLLIQMLSGPICRQGKNQGQKQPGDHPAATTASRSRGQRHSDIEWLKSGSEWATITDAGFLQITDKGRNLMTQSQTVWRRQMSRRDRDESG